MNKEAHKINPFKKTFHKNAMHKNIDLCGMFLVLWLRPLKIYINRQLH